MKMNYIRPELIITRFGKSIITASGGDDPNNGANIVGNSLRNTMGSGNSIVVDTISLGDFEMGS